MQNLFYLSKKSKPSNELFILLSSVCVSQYFWYDEAFSNDEPAFYSAPSSEERLL